MLAMIGIVLAALWLLGIATAYTLGGFVHLLLILALLSILLHFFEGRQHPA